MLAPALSPRRPVPRLAVLAIALATLAAGCATTPPVSTAAAPAADAAFAFRDPRDGAPPPALTPKETRALEAAVSALRRGDLVEAEKALSGRSRKDGAPPAALRLAAEYVALTRGRAEEARGALAAMTAEHPTWIAAVEAEADLAAAEGRSAEALERYRTLLRLAPKDRRAVERVETFRAKLAETKRQEAAAALQGGDLDAARRAAHSLLQLEPASAEAYLLLSRAATAGGKAEDAWTWAKEARRKAPSDRAVSAFAADAAAKAGRWADAATLYEGLAANDPAFVPKAEEARVEFRVQNLPGPARVAAESVRLTRAQLAVLLWWAVPEFRDALVSPGAEIAGDVVDRAVAVAARPDRTYLVRSIGLGFFAVSPETHRVGAETSVSRTELASVLRRVAYLAGRGRTPRGCLAAETPAAAALAECGILRETSSRNVTGREALRALEKAARVGREGGTR